MAKGSKAKIKKVDLGGMKTVCFMNQKGGVAKTTTTVTTAVALAKAGYRVLVVDLDAQANATSLLNIDVVGKPTVYDVIKAEADIRDAIQHSMTPEFYKTDQYGDPLEVDGKKVIKKVAHERDVDVLPADSGLGLLVGEAAKLRAVESRLVKPLQSVSADYDFCLIDCPPALSYATYIALTASDYLIVPTTAALFSIEGFTRLFETVEEIVDFSNEKLKVLGILFTCKRKTKVFNRMYRDCREFAEYLGTRVFDTTIRFTVKFDDACDEKLTILEHAPESGAANDYREFAAELVKAIGKDVM